MGVWIEIAKNIPRMKAKSVTPFVGVWIEIIACVDVFCTATVTPFVGVWIEISVDVLSNPTAFGHSLRGSVD